MKRILIMILTCLVLFGFAACSQDNAQLSQDTATQDVTTQTPDLTTADQNANRELTQDNSQFSLDTIDLPPFYGSEAMLVNESF